MRPLSLYYRELPLIFFKGFLHFGQMNICFLYFVLSDSTPKNTKNQMIDRYSEKNAEYIKQQNSVENNIISAIISEDLYFFFTLTLQS